jgi:hypothetical protein
MVRPFNYWIFKSASCRVRPLPHLMSAHFASPDSEIVPKVEPQKIVDDERIDVIIRFQIRDIDGAGHLGRIFGFDRLGGLIVAAHDGLTEDPIGMAHRGKVCEILLIERHVIISPDQRSIDVVAVVRGLQHVVGNEIRHLAHDMDHPILARNEHVPGRDGAETLGIAGIVHLGFVGEITDPEGKRLGSGRLAGVEKHGVSFIGDLAQTVKIFFGWFLEILTGRFVPTMQTYNAGYVPSLWCNDFNELQWPNLI